MGKKVKDSVLDDYDKVKNKIIRDKVNEIFRNHPKDFYYSTNPDGYEAYYAFRELFKLETGKRKIIDFLIAEEEEAEKKSSQPIDF